MRTVKEPLIIIPAFNEGNNIERVIAAIKNILPEADILIINDGSIDKTPILAKHAGALVVNHPFNLGYGNALQTGYKYALRMGYEYLIQMDGDGQHDPKSVRDLYEEIAKNKNDVVIGSRFINYTYQPPLIRRIGIRFFARIAEFILRERFSDPTSGFRAFNKNAIKFYCQDLYPSDFPDVDVLIMSKKAGLKIKEIPVIMHPAKTKKSMHSGIRPLYYIFKMFLSIIVTVLRKADIKDEERGKK